MKKTFLALAAALAAGACLALDIGDKAPSLVADKWIQGEPVDPGKPDGKTTYVVEFWATWCTQCPKAIPVLNDLHHRLKDRNVVVLSVGYEPEPMVRAYLQKHRMEFAVALDTKQANWGTYISQDQGIPYALIVDTNGVILWTGHPLDRMGRQLDRILAGTYRPEVIKKSRAMEEEIQNALIAKDLPKALAKVDELIALDGENLDYHQARLGLLAQSGQLDKLKGAYEAALRALADVPEQLNPLAWIACTSPFPLCNLDVAWKAATRAAEMTGRKDAGALETLARVNYALGRLDEAAKVQAEALKLADGDQKQMFAATLDYYKSAIALRAELDKGAKKK